MRKKIKQKKEIIKIADIYPLTIIKDRYMGEYSRGQYLAFNLDYHRVPFEIEGDAKTCQAFWTENRRMIVGRGNTVKKAIFSLKNQIRLVLKEKEKGCPPPPNPQRQH